MAGILSELKEANDLINTNDKIEGDIVFNGDAAKWKKLINSFRLKILITLSKKTTVGSYNIATEFASIAGSQPLMTSISDNGELKFADAADSRYTMFNNSGYGSSLYMADYFINLFKDRKDPRLFTFASQTTGAKEAGKAITDFTGYNGGDPISPYSENAKLITAKNISKVNDRFYKDPTNEPSSVLSYSELEFILAEAAARGWISGSVKPHYDNAIKASFSFYQTYVKNPGQYFAGFDVNQYLATPLVAYDNSAPLQQQLEKIITQKYMTMFHQSQWTSYYDYLRTGYPNYPLKSGTAAPFRFRYPQSEYNYNSENLKAALTAQYGEMIILTPNLGGYNRNLTYFYTQQRNRRKILLTCGFFLITTDHEQKRIFRKIEYFIGRIGNLKRFTPGYLKGFGYRSGCTVHFL